EPLIAATIVIVGIENLVRGDEPKGRWLLTFAFGLVHGLGFAAALRESGLGAHGRAVRGAAGGVHPRRRDRPARRRGPAAARAVEAARGVAKVRSPRRPDRFLDRRRFRSR